MLIFLKKVTRLCGADAVTIPTNANDIKTQLTENNYIYNSIGQLTENKAEKVKYEYNASGLVTKVYYNNTLKVQFFYNDKGFRVKKVFHTNIAKFPTKETYYVRDASGSVLAIVTKPAAPIPQLPHDCIVWA